MFVPTKIGSKEMFQLEKIRIELLLEQATENAKRGLADWHRVDHLKSYLEEIKATLAEMK